MKPNPFLGVLFSWLVVMTMNAAPLPVELRCEYRAGPMGIDATKPRLSWCEKSPARGAKPTAWRIHVASSLARLKDNTGDLWDTGNKDFTVSCKVSRKITCGGHQDEKS